MQKRRPGRMAVFPDLEALPALLHASMALMPVIAEKSHLFPGKMPQSRPAALPVLRNLGVPFWQNGIRLRGQMAEIPQKQVQRPQGIIAVVNPPELPHRGLEIIGPHRKLIGRTGFQRLLQRGVFSPGIGASVVHVIAQQIGAGAEFAKSHGGGVHAGDKGAPVAGHLQASSQLRRQIGEFLRVIGKSGLLPHMEIAAHIPVILVVGKQKIPVQRQLFSAGIPGCAAVGRQYRQKSFRHNAPAPAGGCIIGGLKAQPDGQLFQRLHMFAAGISLQAAAVPVLIFNLDSHDGASLPVKESLRLPVNLLPEDFHQRQISRIVGPQLKILPRCQPVRESSVPALPMAPGADPQKYRHPFLLADREKFSQVPLSGKIPLSLPFLMVNPEHIGGQHLHAAGFHFRHRIPPQRFLQPGKMDFPHHRIPGLAVSGKKISVGPVNALRLHKGLQPFFSFLPLLCFVDNFDFHMAKPPAFSVQTAKSESYLHLITASAGFPCRFTYNDGESSVTLFPEDVSRVFSPDFLSVSVSGLPGFPALSVNFRNRIEENTFPYPITAIPRSSRGIAAGWSTLRSGLINAKRERISTSSCGNSLHYLSRPFLRRRPNQNASFSSRYFSRSSILIRSCSMVSRSRTVTAPSFSESKS